MKRVLPHPVSFSRLEQTRLITYVVDMYAGLIGGTSAPRLVKHTRTARAREESQARQRTPHQTTKWNGCVTTPATHRGLSRRRVQTVTVANMSPVALVQLCSLP